MRIPFLSKPRRNELDEVLEQVDQLYRDVSELESLLRESTEGESAVQGFSAVQQLREAMARDDLAAKRSELAQLLDRAAVLRGEPTPSAAAPAIAVVTPQAPPAQAPAITTPELTPAATGLADITEETPVSPGERPPTAPTIVLSEEELRAHLARAAADSGAPPPGAAGADLGATVLSEAELRGGEQPASPVAPPPTPVEPPGIEPMRPRRTEPRFRFLGHRARIEGDEDLVTPMPPSSEAAVAPDLKTGEPARPSPAVPAAPELPQRGAAAEIGAAAQELPRSTGRMASVLEIERDLPEAIILAAIQLRKRMTQAREELMGLEDSARMLGRPSESAPVGIDVAGFRQSMIQEEVAAKRAELDSLLKQSRELEAHIAQQAPKAYAVVVQRSQAEDVATPGRGGAARDGSRFAFPGALVGAAGGGVAAVVARLSAMTRGPGVRPGRRPPRRRRSQVRPLLIGAAILLAAGIAITVLPRLIPPVDQLPPTVEEAEVPEIAAEDTPGALDPTQLVPREAPKTALGFLRQMTPVDALLIIIVIGFIIAGSLLGVIRQLFGFAATAVAIVGGGPVATWASQFTGVFSTFGQARALPLTYAGIVVLTAAVIFFVTCRSYPVTRIGLPEVGERIVGGLLGFVLGLIWMAEVTGILLMAVQYNWVVMDATRDFVKEQMLSTPFLPLVADLFGMITTAVRLLLPWPVAEICPRCL